VDNFGLRPEAERHAAFGTRIDQPDPPRPSKAPSPLRIAGAVQKKQRQFITRLQGHEIAAALLAGSTRAAFTVH